MKETDGIECGIKAAEYIHRWKECEAQLRTY
jgi:hypothetical protein